MLRPTLNSTEELEEFVKKELTDLGLVEFAPCSCGDPLCEGGVRLTQKGVNFGMALSEVRKAERSNIVARASMEVNEIIQNGADRKALSERSMRLLSELSGRPVDDMPRKIVDKTIEEHFGDMHKPEWLS